MTNVKIKIYSDGADIKDMRTVAKNEFVSGFTTNPSLMKKAGLQIISLLPGKWLLSFQNIQSHLRFLAMMKQRCYRKPNYCIC